MLHWVIAVTNQHTLTSLNVALVCVGGTHSGVGTIKISLKIAFLCCFPVRVRVAVGTQGLRQNKCKQKMADCKKLMSL